MRVKSARRSHVHQKRRECARQCGECAAFGYGDGFEVSKKVTRQYKEKRKLTYILAKYNVKYVWRDQHTICVLLCPYSDQKSTLDARMSRLVHDHWIQYTYKAGSTTPQKKRTRDAR